MIRSNSDSEEIRSASDVSATEDEAPASAPPAGAEYPQPLNRELSWLAFNKRVLHQALDERTPLLERVRFLSIFTSNLDEYIMKRVGGLKRQIVAGVSARSADGLSAQGQLRAIREAVVPMLKQQADAFANVIRPGLAEQGIHLLAWEKLTPDERARANTYFHKYVFPVLTPLAVDPGHPFPFISNLSTSLGVVLRQPQREEKLFARVKVPEVLPGWVRVDPGSDGKTYRFVSLTELIRHNLDHLFPDMVVLDVMPFRITRNADVERDEEDAEDLLEMIEEELRARRFAQVVRLEYGANPNPFIRDLLLSELNLDEDDLYEMPGELDFTDLKVVADLDLPKLKFEPWVPVIPKALAEHDADIFGIVRSGDLLVHPPYESFAASVERFILAAADDPKVVAIKMTVYRTGENSPFIHALMRAAQAGKQVVCLVELKARFDEERNIYWAHQLEKAGVHVVYGVVGLKTHNKCALVVRQDADELRCYVHIGTGNYNTQTARLYTDLGLLTCNPDITGDVVEVFNFLTGRSLKRDYKKLLVAPVTMRDRFLALIREETEHARAGRPCGIAAKMNSLEEEHIIAALYDASRAGVPVELYVRGFCCLRPGVPGSSENIKVVSVVGRFLEHSRIFHFRRGAEDPLDGAFYIGSTDWMYRNLQERVEVVAPVEGRALREKMWEILEALRRDRRQAWDLQSDGTYVLRTPPEGAHADAPEVLGTQQHLMNLTRQRNAR